MFVVRYRWRAAEAWPRRPELSRQLGAIGKGLLSGMRAASDRETPDFRRPLLERTHRPLQWHRFTAWRRLTRGWSGPAHNQLIMAGWRWAPAAQPQDVRRHEVRLCDRLGKSMLVLPSA